MSKIIISSEILNPVNDTIAAIATPAGVGGIAVVRISGPRAIEIADAVCHRPRLSESASHTAHLVEITDDEQGNILDEGVATVFRGPRSFTGEDTVEIAVHGSRHIQRRLLLRLMEKGCRMAEAGEFTRRAFLNGRMDLAQAESVADLIASESAAAHRLAIHQMKGGFSEKLSQLREKLIEFASLLELELDFSEEDVEFADRSRLMSLCSDVKSHVDNLASSFRLGKVFKEGIPVAIVGEPNAGKSTLLNTLLSDDKAIVSPIPGTTRDIVEDTCDINGMLFRFIDTAGLRATDDTVERLGIERTHKALVDASVVVWLIDPTENVAEQIARFEEYTPAPHQHIFKVYSKSDKSAAPAGEMSISASTGEGIEELRKCIYEIAVEGHDPQAEMMVTNVRHHESLVRASESLARAMEGLQGGISADFVAQDVRETTAHLAEITGEVTTDNLLHTIFARFCIGK